LRTGKALIQEWLSANSSITPENDMQAEAFNVVRQALVNSRKAAVGKVSFSGRENIIAVVPVTRRRMGRTWLPTIGAVREQPYTVTGDRPNLAILIEAEESHQATTRMAVSSAAPQLKTLSNVNSRARPPEEVQARAQAT
jgi:hypothetical protein